MRSVLRAKPLQVWVGRTGISMNTGSVARRLVKETCLMALSAASHYQREVLKRLEEQGPVSWTELTFCRDPQGKSDSAAALEDLKRWNHIAVDNGMATITDFEPERLAAEGNPFLLSV